ncbi:hypothetical protein FJZ26_00920 [Candidatus Parvarchaeota archaeon]|nr:hypothetical protein [Candidatus Parvarchaeota archaeon]
MKKFNKTQKIVKQATAAYAKRGIPASQNNFLQAMALLPTFLFILLSSLPLIFPSQVLVSNARYGGQIYVLAYQDKAGGNFSSGTITILPPSGKNFTTQLVSGQASLNATQLGQWIIIHDGKSYAANVTDSPVLNANTYLPSQYGKQNHQQQDSTVPQFLLLGPEYVYAAFAILGLMALVFAWLLVHSFHERHFGSQQHRSNNANQPEQPKSNRVPTTTTKFNASSTKQSIQPNKPDMLIQKFTSTINSASKKPTAFGKQDKTHVIQPKSSDTGLQPVPAHAKRKLKKAS